MSLAEVREQYNLIALLESNNLEHFRPLTTQFCTAESFVSYGERARKQEVRNDG